MGSADVHAMRLTAVEVWNPGRVEVLSALSDLLLRHERLRRDPAAVPLAFWLRRAHVTELERGFRSEMSGCRVPAGLVLHITPANVDTMFVFSWALSFLAGNANIVRLTTRLSPLMEDLLETLQVVFSRFPDAVQGNLFVSYEHNDQVTESLSSSCDLRVVWGGDETVRRLRAVPLNPHAAERAFASKRSLSVILAKAYCEASPVERRQLAERMAVDIVPFGQMACSSPHQVYWVGETANELIGAFGRDLEAAVIARGGAMDLGAAVRRMNAAFSGAAEGATAKICLEPHTATIIATEPKLAETASACGAGLLIHAACSSLDEVTVLLRVEHQTITYFGLSVNERERFALLAGKAGVDRLVPIGRALDFEPHWDGFALWADFTRGVTVL
jgi:hypothetical protein